MTQVAESGKARYTTVDKLQPGMKVHEDIMGRRGTPLVNAGEVLTRTHVSKLKHWENRPAPQGPALKRAKKGDPIQHAPFTGGHRISDFNPRGILVSATLSSGTDDPAVVADPTKSPLIQNAKRNASVSVPEDFPVDSPLFRKRVLEGEIKTAERLNAKLGGSLHTVEKQPVLEDEMKARLAELEDQNSKLIEGLQRAKPSGRSRTKSK